MKRLLLLHTAGAESTVALAQESGVVAHITLPGRSASERLVPEVRALLQDAGWRLQALTAIVVVHGPGSFTGVRVGLSAAKGMSEAAGVPLIAVSRLELLAKTAGGQGLVYAALDAGRGELYFGAYDDGMLQREELLTAADVVALAGNGALIVCEGKAAELLGGARTSLVPEPVAPDLLPLALTRLAEGALDDAALLDANYLRRTDFEIQAKLARRAAVLEA